MTDGDRGHVADRDDGSVPVPTGSDPLATLREVFADVDEPVDELRDRAREAALNEAGR